MNLPQLNIVNTKLIKFLPPKGGINLITSTLDIFPDGLVDECLKSITLTKQSISKLGPICNVNLKKQISQLYDFHHGKILITNGASEALFLFLLATKPTAVLIPSPYFPGYKALAEFTGARVVEYNVSCSEDEIYKNIYDNLANIDCIIINTPNNPTGICLSELFVLKVLKVVEINNKWLVVDDTYQFMINSNNYLKGSKNLVVVSSLAKRICLPELRIGYVATINSSLLNRISLIKLHMTLSTNFISQYIALSLLNLYTPDYLRIYQDKISNNVEIILKYLNKSKVSYFKVGTHNSGYLYLKTRDNFVLYNELLKLNVFGLPGTLFGDKTGVRLTVSVQTKQIIKLQ